MSFSFTDLKMRLDDFLLLVRAIPFEILRGAEWKNNHGLRDDIKTFGEIPYLYIVKIDLYIVKIDVFTPSPCGSHPLIKGKFACKDRQLYPLPPSIFTM